MPHNASDPVYRSEHSPPFSDGSKAPCPIPQRFEVQYHEALQTLPVDPLLVPLLLQISIHWDNPGHKRHKPLPLSVRLPKRMAVTCFMFFLSFLAFYCPTRQCFNKVLAETAEQDHRRKQNYNDCGKHSVVVRRKCILELCQNRRNSLQFFCCQYHRCPVVFIPVIHKRQHCCCQDSRTCDRQHDLEKMSVYNRSRQYALLLPALPVSSGNSF